MGTIAERKSDILLLTVRIIVGVIFVAHGAQKLFGAFGGSGMAGIVGMVGPVGYLVAIGEFFGGLGLAFGLLTRFSAAALIVIILGAIEKLHGNGFFAPMGIELPLSQIPSLLVLLAMGPGRLALSNVLPKRKTDANQPTPATP